MLKERSVRRTLKVKLRESAGRAKRGQCEVNAHLHIEFILCCDNPPKTCIRSRRWRQQNQTNLPKINLVQHVFCTCLIQAQIS